jgi:DNA-binding GntR family transcriptional regulator
LRRLEVENLVTIIPRRGTFVTDVTITDLQALVEVRTELEGLAARLAARRVNRVLVREIETLFEECGERASEGAAKNENEMLMDRDERFHQLVYRAADNAFLEDTLNQLYTLSLRLWYLALDRLHQDAMRETTQEHLEIVDAIRRSDADAAEDRMRQHVLRFHREIKAVL